MIGGIRDRLRSAVRGRSGGETEEHWSDHYADPEEGWIGLRNPDLVASQKRRIAKLWLAGCLTALPVSLIALFMSGASWTRSIQAIDASEDAAAGPVSAPSPISGGCAESLVLDHAEANLGTAHAWRVVPLGGELHPRGELHRFEVEVEWDAETADRMVWTVVVARSPAPCGAMSGPAVEWATATPDDAELLLPGAAAPDIDRFQVLIDEWSAAWADCNQLVLKRLAQSTAEADLPCFDGPPEWRYQPGTMQVVAAAILPDEATVVADLRFVMARRADAEGGAVIGRLVVERSAWMRLDGTLTLFVELAAPGSI